MARRTGIILAYDSSYLDLLLLEAVAPYIDIVKVGLEAMTAQANMEGLRTVAIEVCRFVDDKPGVMWDMKLNDIPNTVSAAARNIARMEVVKFFTVHASAGVEAMRAAQTATANTSAQVLAVTVLTSLGGECESIFGDSAPNKVLDFAKRALEAGVPGLVCSPRELELLANADLSSKFITVTPGVRSPGVDKGDQKRVMTPAEAATLGADYIVVGREIMEASEPSESAKRIRQALDAVLERA